MLVFNYWIVWRNLSSADFRRRISRLPRHLTRRSFAARQENPILVRLPVETIFTPPWDLWMPSNAGG